MASSAAISTTFASTITATVRRKARVAQGDVFCACGAAPALVSGAWACAAPAVSGAASLLP